MRIWERYPEVFEAVRGDHEAVQLYGGHDINHALRVAERAKQIAFDEWGSERLAEVAGLAGLCHNADRVLQKKLNIGRREVGREAVYELVMLWLQHSDATSVEKAEIVIAILSHDGKNGENDSFVHIALMDADRIISLEADLMARSGQHYHDLPTVDYRYFLDDPEATYRNPRSVLRDIAYSLDWVKEGDPVCVRTRLGKKLGKERQDFFLTFFETLKKQLEEVGLMPYPF